jgi:lactate dehydrogenase-like 2-hydroxyacid dehydrogenase
MKKKHIIMIAALTAAAAGITIYIRSLKKLMREANEKVLKFKQYYYVYNQWIKNCIDQYSVEKAMLDHGYRTITIYGNGEIGNRLYEALKDSEVKVKCFIDKKADDYTKYNEDGIAVYGINEADEYEDVDAIIVTTVNIFEEIEQKLRENNVKCDIVSLDDVLAR